MVKTDCKFCKFKSPAANKLNDAESEVLDIGCAEVQFKTREIIIKQNALSTNVAYIKDGLVKIHINDLGKERIMKILKAPAYLCLPSNFSERLNHFSATALEDTTACFIDLSTFKNFIFNNGEFAYEIILDMSKNELQNFHYCLHNVQKQTTGRIADCILFFAKEIYENNSFTLPITRQEIGDTTATTRENVSRILTEFHNEKIIEITGKKITILDEKLLLKISEKA